MKSPLAFRCETSVTFGLQEKRSGFVLDFLNWIIIIIIKVLTLCIGLFVSTNITMWCGRRRVCVQFV